MRYTKWLRLLYCSALHCTLLYYTVSSWTLNLNCYAISVHSCYHSVTPCSLLGLLSTIMPIITKFLRIVRSYDVKRLAVNWATVKWATENWATGKFGNGKFGNHFWWGR